MFDPVVLADFAKSHRKEFEALVNIEFVLNKRFSRMEVPIRALILAVLSGEALLLVGPPGTAKSRLIRTFCSLIEMVDENDPGADHPDYFEYLLTPFTEPNELFGFYDVAKIMQGDMYRLEAGMMQNAKVVYLDEVFNASSAILNAILSFMNEKILHDRGTRRKVALQCLFAATNHTPQDDTLQAVYDRFVLRCNVLNVPATPPSISELLRMAWVETYSKHRRISTYPTLLDDLDKLRDHLKDLTSQGKLSPQDDPVFYNRLAQLVQHARQYNLSEMSNRRMIKMTHIMLLHRLYEAIQRKELDGKTEIRLGAAELQLMPAYFLDRADEETIIKMKRAAQT